MLVPFRFSSKLQHQKCLCGASLCLVHYGTRSFQRFHLHLSFFAGLLSRIKQLRDHQEQEACHQSENQVPISTIQTKFPVVCENYSTVPGQCATQSDLSIFQATLRLIWCTARKKNRTSRIVPNHSLTRFRKMGGNNLRNPTIVIKLAYDERAFRQKPSIRHESDTSTAIHGSSSSQRTANIFLTEILSDVQFHVPVLCDSSNSSTITFPLLMG